MIDSSCRVFTSKHLLVFWKRELSPDTGHVLQSLLPVSPAVFRSRHCPLSSTSREPEGPRVRPHCHLEKAVEETRMAWVPGFWVEALQARGLLLMAGPRGSVP